jgi:hypothetical protein
VGALSIWDGTAWQIVSQQGPSGGNAMWVGPSAPPGTPATGDEWFDTDETNATLVLPLSVANGGTGAANAAGARTNLAMPGEELAYNEITTSATTTATTAAAATLVIEGTTRSYDGSAVIVEFYTSLLYSPGVAGAWTVANLWDGNTDLGQFGQVGGGSANAVGSPCYSRRRITPTVGTHNYRIKAWVVSSGTGTVAATGPSYVPAFIRVTRA